MSPVGQKQVQGFPSPAFIFILGFMMGVGILLPHVQPGYSDIDTFHRDSLVTHGVLDHPVLSASFLTKAERRVDGGIGGKGGCLHSLEPTCEGPCVQLSVTCCRCVAGENEVLSRTYEESISGDPRTEG